MAALPPGPAALGLVSPHAQIIVAGEDTLAVVDPVAVHVPGRVAGVLPRGAFIYVLDDGGLAAVMVRAPSPPAPEPDDHYSASARRDDCIKAGFILSFAALVMFVMLLQFVSQGIGVMATAAPEICYPWEAPQPSPAWMPGDGSWNGDHRAHAAEGGWNGTHRDDRERRAEGGLNANRDDRERRAEGGGSANRERRAQGGRNANRDDRERRAEGGRNANRDNRERAAEGDRNAHRGNRERAAEGDPNANHDHRAHAAAAADKWNRDGPTQCAGEGWSSNERVNCFTLLVRKASDTCLRMRPEDAARTTAAAAPACYRWEAPQMQLGDGGNYDHDSQRAIEDESTVPWSCNENRINCFNLMAREAKEICFA